MCLHVLRRSRIFLTSGQWSNYSDTSLADLLLIADNGVNKPSFLWGIDFSLKSLNSLINASIFTCNEASLKLSAFPLMFLEFEGVVSVDCSNFFDTDLCATGFAQVLVFNTEVKDTEVGDAEVEVEFETNPEDVVLLSTVVFKASTHSLALATVLSLS